jgi:DNA-binding transcriptional LysR family regulator
VAVAPAGLLPGKQKSLGLDELAAHPLLLLRRSIGVGTYERLQHLFQERGLVPNIALYSSDVGLLRDVLARGFPGLAVIPDSEATDLGAGFQVFALDLELPDYQLSLVHPRQGGDAQLIEVLLQLWQVAA